MSRPAGWAPLAPADPVPGDPAEVALTGARLLRVAGQISADVAWLRSLCTAQFWDSGAGRAFQGQVDEAAGRLARAHQRYLAAGQALGDSLSGPGYAGALDQAQALSLRALNTGQQAWAVMRAQLPVVALHSAGVVPYQGRVALDPGAPVLDPAGNPVEMLTPAGADPLVRAAVSRYNASALEYRTANGWLAEAIALRDEAAARAAATIQAAISADGLQDQTGLWHDITATASASFGWAQQHWAQVVGDIANVCGWIASALGVLALVFAFICPPVAAALEGMALTLTEITAVCHLILAITGQGSWADVGLDMISLATFGWGRNLLRAGEATVEAAGELATAGAAARADTLSAGLRSGEGAVKDISVLTHEANTANDAAIVEDSGRMRLPGIFGKFSKASLADFKPVNPVTAFKTVRETDWESVLGKNPAQTIRLAVRQAVHMSNPEISESLTELGKVPDIANITKLTGINFTSSITRYGRIWARTQTAALGIDVADKADSVLNYFGIHVPGYDWVKEQATT